MIVVEVSPDGLLIINGEKFEALIPNPRTGRYNLEVALASNRLLVARKVRLGATTIPIVSPDGSTKAAFKIVCDLGVGIVAPG